MAKIIAPNKQYTGLSASVLFTNGIGETEIPELIEWFSKHGYEVENETLKDTEEIEDTEDDIEKTLDEMTINELRAYADEKGIDIGKSTSRDGILKKIKDADK